MLLTAAAGALYRAGQPPACWPLERPPPLLETSMPGVFAAGNVWHRPVNAVKRLALATGEGAIAIQFQHEYLKPLGSGRHPPRRDELIAGYLRL